MASPTQRSKKPSRGGLPERTPRAAATKGSNAGRRERPNPPQEPNSAQPARPKGRQGATAAARTRPKPPNQGKSAAPPLPGGPPRSGRVALVGRPNVGKSTLLNAALGAPLAAVSPTPQTTRDALLGVVHHGTAEIALLDTPGLHRPKTELGKLMNHAAREAARAADVVVVVVEVPLVHGAGKGAASVLRPHPGDLALIKDLGGAGDAPSAARALLVVNKVDRVHDKGRLLPLLEAYAHAYEFAAIVPISALREDGVRLVLDQIAELLPTGAWVFEPDTLTDRPTRYFAGEYVREQILIATSREVPHATAVQIEAYVEPSTPEGAVRIEATILVERPGQKRILIGTGGEMLKRIGTAARLRIEELIERKVLLKLWVKVEPDWREKRRLLDELGFSSSGQPAASSAPEAELDDEPENDR